MPATTRRRHERQKQIRAKIKAQSFVRKVWLLPSEMCERLVDYQEAHLIRSEVEAARVLLDIALSAREAQARQPSIQSQPGDPIP